MKVDIKPEDLWTLVDEWVDLYDVCKDLAWTKTLERLDPKEVEEAKRLGKHEFYNKPYEEQLKREEEELNQLFSEWLEKFSIERSV